MDDLDNKLKKSLSLSFLDKYVGYFLRFISTIIVARLVSPHDIGIFSVAFVVISLGHVIRDFGVAQYLIKEKKIDQQKITAAFTLMLIIAWSLFALLILGRGWIAEFYDKPEMADALGILSLIFLFAPFGSVRIALLRRNMDFKSLAKINIFSYLSLQSVTLYLAFVGFGFSALAWGQVAGVVAINMGTFFYCRLPFVLPSLKGIKQVMHFGAHVSGANIAEVFGNGSPDLVMGRILTMEAVGFFGRAQGLINLFKVAVQAAVWPVVLPYFSDKNRQGLSIQADYEKTISYYTIFAFPFLAVLGVMPELVIQTLFGTAWLPAAPIVKWLSMGAILEALFPFLGPFLVAQGLEKLNLKITSINAGLIFTCLLVGCYFGFMWAAVGYFIAECLSTILKFYYLKCHTGLALLSLWRAIYKSIQITIWMSCLGGTLLILPIDNIYLKFIFISFVMLISWIILVKVLNHPVGMFLNFKRLERKVA